MLVELLFNILKGVLLFFINLMPVIDIPLPIGIINWFINVAGSVAYFLPIKDMIVLFSAWVAYTTFRINWKLVQRIWDNIFH